MDRDLFIDHIKSSGCIVLRTSASGYSVVRNVINAKMSGVPKNNPLRPATVCSVCRTLGIDVPEEVRNMEPLIDGIRKDHGL